MVTTEGRRVEWSAMRRLLVLLSLSGLVGVLCAFGAVGLAACGGGNDKPPLTPDSLEPSDNSEAGTPGTPGTPPSTGTATPPK